MAHEREARSKCNLAFRMYHYLDHLCPLLRGILQDKEDWPYEGGCLCFRFHYMTLSHPMIRFARGVRSSLPDRVAPAQTEAIQLSWPILIIAVKEIKLRNSRTMIPAHRIVKSSGATTEMKFRCLKLEGW